MKNELKYFYNLDVRKTIKKENSYYFTINNKEYIFSQTERTYEEIQEINNVIYYLIRQNIPTYEFIPNNNNQLITPIFNKNYILMKNNINSNEYISFYDVINFSIRTRNRWNYPYINRTNWGKLWLNKANYLEQLFKNSLNNHSYIYHSFNYFLGITENTLQLFNEFYEQNYNIYSISHKRLSFNMTLNEFYNPLNFIIDVASRDISEYLKSKLINNIDIYSEYEYILKNNLYSVYEKKLMFLRLLYPSFYLDMYEKFFFNNDSTKLEKILVSHLAYENRIKKIYNLFSVYFKNIPYINWLDY